MNHDVMDGGGEPHVGDGPSEPDEPLLPPPPEPEVELQAHEAPVVPSVVVLQEPGPAEDGHDQEAVRHGGAELMDVDRLRPRGGFRRGKADGAGVRAGEHEGLEVGRIDEGRVHGDGDRREPEPGPGDALVGAEGARCRRGEDRKRGETRRKPVHAGGHGEGDE